ncbi:DUF6705 family protein [Chryseobacterium sp. IHB B 17019]|uniref:DUF6705 family protein n=1 Tax=Chryseobacterium sp. IHB B 17019 TaxID=1721091 RepID=UPI0012376712|nr:DUF6705 family protein [Chryseobacterium sp. IHB B 17019]
MKNSIRINRSMKKIVFIALAVFYIPVTFAQDLPKKGSNLTNPNLNKFRGNWISINGIDTIRMKLKIENISIKDGLEIRADVVLGYISYKHGNQLIVDNIKNSTSSYKDNKHSIIAGLDQKRDTISGNLVDEPKSKFFDVKIIKKDSKTIELVLGRGKVLKVGTTPKNGRTLPAIMIFRKEKE